MLFYFYIKSCYLIYLCCSSFGRFVYGTIQLKTANKMNQKAKKKRDKWLIISLTVFLPLLLVIHCQNPQTPGKSADVALYIDKGADEGCIKATTNMFGWMGYTVSSVKADYINNESLDNFSILCFPGGDMYQYAQDISSGGKCKIKNFIRNDVG